MAAAQETIQLTVKTMTGDLLSFEIPSGTQVRQFKPMVYDACPDLPYGCAKLFRQDRDTPLMNTESFFVPEELFLFVDPDNVYMDIFNDSILVEVNNNDAIRMVCTFYEKGDDTPIQIVGMIYNLKQWGDERTFTITRRTERGWSVRQFEPTTETVWYSDALECIQAINTQMNRNIQNIDELYDLRKAQWSLERDPTEYRAE